MKKKQVNEINEIINDINLGESASDNTQGSILTRYEIECMLPDYVFGKLDEIDQELFEKAVIDFPDLEEEVKDAKSLFAHIEKFDYKKMVYDKSQYLPDRVVANLEKRNVLYTPWRPTWKRVVATGTFAAIILIYFYFVNKEDIPQMADFPKQHNIIDFFTADEKDVIADNMQEIAFNDINYSATHLQDVFMNIDSPNLQEFDDYYSSTINSAFIETIKTGGTISLNHDNDYMELMNNIENIDEADLQSILNQINNL
jgi:hypothetical protein